MKSFKIGDLTISLPIIQGGMGVGVSLSGLASAVASEGGVGVISCAGLGLLYPDYTADYFENNIRGLKEEIRKARAKTCGVLGVNVMVALSNFSDLVKTAISEKIDIIFSGAGLPLDLPSYLEKDSTTKLVPIVSSARAAKLIIEKWKTNYNYLPDAIVVEGPEAGGHLGYKLSQIEDAGFTLETIVPEVVSQVSEFEKKYSCTIPVIAAGGIYDGADIYKIMALGATAVQLGSKFVTTEECDASDAFKQSYIEAKSEDIGIIASPVGMPGRALIGDFLRRTSNGETMPKSCPYHCIKTCDYKTSPYCIILALYNAAKGNFDKGYVFAGAKAYKAKSILSVKETMQNLVAEYDAEVIKNS